MDLHVALSVVFQIAMGVSLAACAGFRAFAPLLVVGLAGRLDLIPLAERFEWLSSDAALVVLATAVIAETLADKIPVADHFLDLAATLVRPIAGALVVASPLTGFDPLLATVVGIVLGSTVAGGVHLAKSKTRLASTALTGASANPVLSVAEDAVSIGGSVLAIFLPLLTFLFVCVLAYFAYRFLRRRRATKPMHSTGVAMPPR
jgi:hypothetical protein